ncbi:hypothetical protein LIER_31594 [Lithospermum erythrorhizon]|uniref:Mitochondrial protein n=1 Tax=Lithospermum erythrorhizon TaxID=34254 RepID=A0AAV3RWR6_LITER
MTMRLEDHYHDFMYGLNCDLYGSIRSSLNTHEPLPFLEAAYQKIREEESLRKASDAPIGNEFVALSFRSNPRMGDYVGYREWWETLNRKGVRSGATASDGRGVIGSTIVGAGTGCVVGNRVAGGAAAGGGVALHAVFSDGADVARSPGGEGTVPSMSQDQWQRLMSLIGNSDSPSASDRLMGKFALSLGFLIREPRFMLLWGSTRWLHTQSIPVWSPLVPTGLLHPVGEPPTSPSEAGATAEVVLPRSEDVVAPTEAEYGWGWRERAPPRHLQDYILNVVRHSSPLLSSISPCSSLSSDTSYPLTHYDPGWCEAMKAEIHALENNGTWSLVELPTGKKALGSRWVYKIKYKSDGSVERLKPRLLVFGNH